MSPEYFECMLALFCYFAEAVDCWNWDGKSPGYADCVAYLRGYGRGAVGYSETKAVTACEHFARQLRKDLLEMAAEKLQCIESFAPEDQEALRSSERYYRECADNVAKIGVLLCELVRAKAGTSACRGLPS